MLQDKKRFNTGHDWEVLGDDFDSISSETILDATVQAPSFYYSLLSYLKKGVSRFVDIIDKPESAIEEPKGIVKPITDSENEKERKVSEHIAKKKA